MSALVQVIHGLYGISALAHGAPPLFPPPSPLPSLSLVLFPLYFTCLHSFIHLFYSPPFSVIFSVFLIHVFTEAPPTGAGGLSFGLSGGSGLNRQFLDSFHRCCPYSLPWQELVTPTQYTSVSLKVYMVSCRVKGVNVDWLMLSHSKSVIVLSQQVAGRK